MKKIIAKIQPLIYVINDITGLELKVNPVEIKHTFPFYPIAGLFVGLIFVLFIDFSKLIINNHIVALISALTFAPFLYYLNRGRNLDALIRFSKQIKSNSSNDFIQSLKENASIITLIILAFAKIGATAYITFHQPTWLILAPITSATIFATFYAYATKDSYNITNIQLFTPWIIALIFALVIGKIAAYATLATIAFISYLAFRSIAKLSGSNAKDSLFGFCELSECFVLIAALLFL
ncbi:MAG: hypothetical protein ACRC37_03100 [Lentisphaeria bacterium]